jgi:hypothetical protein
MLIIVIVGTFLKKQQKKGVIKVSMFIIVVTFNKTNQKIEN